MVEPTPSGSTMAMSPTALDHTLCRSDGAIPHLINIQFHKKMTIEEIAMFVDITMDESYTPTKFSIRAGTNFHDLQEVKHIEISEPRGWVIIPVTHPKDVRKPLRAFCLQIAILANNQMGRDSHVRQIKIFGPRASAMPEPVPFRSVEFTMYETLR